MQDTLNAGHELRVDQEIRKNNEKFNLIMQQDGNPVLYHGAIAVQANGTFNPALGLLRPVVARMQGDGNFVLYAPNDIPIWATLKRALII